MGGRRIDSFVRRVGAHPDAFRALSAVALLGSVAAYFSLRASGSTGLAASYATQGAYLFPVALSFALAWIVRSHACGQERRFWTLFGVAVGALLLSETFYSVVAITGGSGDVLLTLSVLLTMASGFFFVPAMLITTRYHADPMPRKIRYLTDAVLLGVLVYMVLLFGVVSPWYRLAGLTLEMSTTSTVYSAVGLFLLVGLLLNLGSLRFDRWRVWERILAAGIGIYGAGTLLAPLWHAAAQGGGPPYWLILVETLWMLGFAVGGVGIAHRIADPGDAWNLQAFYPYELRRGIVAIPVLIVVTSLATLAVTAAVARTVSAETASILTVCAAIISVTLVVRFGAMGLEFTQLSSRSLSDPLTELGNHRHLYECLEREVDRAVHLDAQVALIALDIDGFRRLNAECGHVRGDEFLQDLSARMRSLVDPRFALCRLEGDEFMVVMESVAIHDARATAERLRVEVLARSIEYGVPLTASAGIAVFPRDAEGPEKLLSSAASALFWAKCQGRDRVCVYDSSTHGPVVGRDGITGQNVREDLGTLQTLATAVDGRESGARYHSRNVARLTGLLASSLGLEDAHVRLIEQAALLHDIGKIGVSERILGKPSALSAAEMASVREHPALGERLLASAGIPEILPWVRSHHERWDGGGYPDGLRGQEIPLEARVLALCDAYDAMTSERPYRPGLSHTAALQEIDLNMGTQFDPLLAERFIRVVSGDNATRHVPTADPDRVQPQG
jgi:diguanylate cyclase (GGDEF)-like protein/putative nucleotidyltransferase with HDIG domain